MKLRKFAAALVALSVSASCLPAGAETTDITEAYPFGALQRRMEKLDRGLAAMQTEKGIYLSWSLMNDEDAVFGTAEENVSFEIYRDGEKVDDVEDTTNYLDTLGSPSSVYKVVSSRGDESAEVSAFETGSNYFDIPVDRPPASPYGAYTINDTSVGDLDGDGQYELIIKWDSNGKDNSHSGTTGVVLLDAYRLDGTRLWDSPINLGRNIRAGALHAVSCL